MRMAKRAVFERLSKHATALGPWPIHQLREFGCNRQFWQLGKRLGCDRGIRVAGCEVGEMPDEPATG